MERSAIRDSFTGCETVSGLRSLSSGALRAPRWLHPGYVPLNLCKNPVRSSVT